MTPKRQDAPTVLSYVQLLPDRQSPELEKEYRADVEVYVIGQLARDTHRRGLQWVAWPAITVTPDEFYPGADRLEAKAWAIPRPEATA